ncbi:MAG: sulfatase-like hydrolase/transferase [Rhodobacteraceae bacterium]|nr:sulfatase-like hydrolase/transferase [Paracoccaceae bacterium]
MPDRPSFILFITDQHRADFLGCYGHPVLRTPHIDAIAAAGTRYDRFYVASPVCMPNRASLMTARLPSSHGVRMNGIPLDQRNVTFVDLLRAADYETALIGKSHLQIMGGSPPMMPRPPVKDGYHVAPAPLSEAVRHDLSSDRYRSETATHWADPGAAVPVPFYGFDHVELVTGHGDALGGDYRRWLLERCPEADSLTGAANQLPHGYACPQAVRTALPEHLYPTAYIAERAEAWLRSRVGSDRPFFLMVSFPDPHHPFNPPGHYWDLYDPDAMPVPEAFTRNDWMPPPHVAGIHAQRSEGTAALKGMGTIGVTAREAQEAQALTCGMIAMIDDAVGRVRAAPGAAGAVQVFTSDHGDHLGDHRLMLKGAEQYDQITRVPMLWADPDRRGPASTGAMGQTHDIGTTILDRARIAPAIGMQGISLLEGGRDEALIQYDHQKTNPGIGQGPRVHTLRHGRWRLSLIAGVDWAELYDLDSDPGELVNLWNSPDHAGVRADLLERLARAEIAAVDRAPFPVAQA